jgi:hypothetical protein
MPHFLPAWPLGAAINVKLIPALLIPVLPARRHRVGSAAAVIGGLAIGVVPFVSTLFTSWTSFKQNALDYNSYWDNWGIPLFIQHAEYSIAPNIGRAAHAMFWSSGRYVIIVCVLAVGVLAHVGRR